MASAISGRAASAAILLLLCLAPAGGDRDQEFNERGALSPGLRDKGLVTTRKLGDRAPQKEFVCNWGGRQMGLPGVAYIKKALWCVLNQFDNWAGSPMDQQLVQLRGSYMPTRYGVRSTVGDALRKSLESNLVEDGKAWRTRDGRFRIEPLREDEYTFLTEHGQGEAIIQHWLNNPLSAMVQFYAIVADSYSKPRKWIVMLEAANLKQPKYVLTGPAANAEKDGELWPQYLHFSSRDFTSCDQPQEPLEPPATGCGTQKPPRQSRYNEFYEAVRRDVEFLGSFTTIPDYSLVVRMGPAGGERPWSMVNGETETLEAWDKFPKFQGAGSVFRTMHWRPSETFNIKDGKAFQVSVEIVDYMRTDLRTGSGLPSGDVLSQMRSKFRPFTFNQYPPDTSPTDTSPRLRFRCCISNPKAGVGDPSPKKLEEAACKKKLPMGICTPLLFQ